MWDRSRILYVALYSWKCLACTLVVIMTGTYGEDIGGLGVSLKQELGREGVWKEECHPGHMDKGFVHHPEEDDWTIVRVIKGEIIVQVPRACSLAHNVRYKSRIY